jgi:hypothetical protein
MSPTIPACAKLCANSLTLCGGLTSGIGCNCPAIRGRRWQTDVSMLHLSTRARYSFRAGLAGNWLQRLEIEPAGDSVVTQRIAEMFENLRARRDCSRAVARSSLACRSVPPARNAGVQPGSQTRQVVELPRRLRRRSVLIRPTLPVLLKNSSPMLNFARPDGFEPPTLRFEA